MKRNALIAIAAGFLVVIVAWYLVIYSPKGDDLKKAEAATASERAKTQDLETTLARLRAQARSAPQQQALLRKFDQAIPKTPDEGEFIIQMREIADESGIDFLSIAPSPPAASGSSSTIALNISVSGSFFQIKNYLTKIETLERLVIIDGLNISGGGGSTGTGGTSTGATSTDTTTLSVTLTARMFTRALPPVAAGAAPTTPGTDSSTTTAPGGATSSSTVPTGSSTTGGA